MMQKVQSFRLQTVARHLRPPRGPAITSRLFHAQQPALDAAQTAASGPSEEVLESREGKAVTITLNRPKALNALNSNMIRLLTPKYKEWHKHPHEQVIIMKGAGEKAFCAGGDVVAIYHASKEVKSGKGTVEEAAQFFYDEYYLNYLIATLPAAQVSILDGITMGGGVGVSVHGKFRVATEKTVFAMPETGIGFFCDVGGTYFLPRLERGLGMYLALAGARLKGEEVYQAGVATHFVHSSKLQQLEADLRALDDVSTQKVAQVLAKHNSGSGGRLNVPRELLEVFSQDSVEGILGALEKRDEAWAKDTLAALRKMSPTSLKVVHESQRRGAAADIAECLKMEYRMCLEFIRNNDFSEGVRALLVDKDKKPQFKPLHVDHVTPDMLAKYFAPLSADKELKL